MIFLRMLLLLVCGCLLIPVSCVAPYQGEGLALRETTEEAPAGSGIPEGYVKFICQPNGWGATPDEAIRDLRERLFPWYERNYGDRPGFSIDRDWYALVEVTPGRMWQADGRLWWYAQPAVRPAPRPSVGPDRSGR